MKKNKQDTGEYNVLVFNEKEKKLRQQKMSELVMLGDARLLLYSSDDECLHGMYAWNPAMHGYK